MTSLPETINEHSVVLFDGVCNLCNASINFIIRHDKKDLFRFSPLQADFARELLKKYPAVPDKMQTIILLEKKKMYTKSTAALRITKNLSGIWKMVYIFIIIPKFIRDAVYGLISKNRYKWFGKKETCMIPTPALQQKFIQ